MQVGDLVKGIFTGEMWVITEVRNDNYVIVNNRWTIPKDHLEVLNADR